jgi:hypothetical protein
MAQAGPPAAVRKCGARLARSCGAVPAAAKLAHAPKTLQALSLRPVARSARRERVCAETQRADAPCFGDGGRRCRARGGG